jgi:hypothetical protein
MKRSAFALAVLAIGFAVCPARADYALVRFEDGWYRIWWDSAGTPWGVGWTKIAIGMLRSFPCRRGRVTQPGFPLTRESAGRDCANYGTNAARLQKFIRVFG